MPPPDGQTILRNIARILLYPLFLLNWLVVGLFCCVFSPCVCAFCARKQAQWGGSTDEYIHTEAHAQTQSAAQDDAFYRRLEGGEAETEVEREESGVTRGLSDPTPPLPIPLPLPPTGGAATATTGTSPSASPPPSGHAPPSLAPRTELKYSNFYFETKTGIKLAVDVWLPVKGTACVCVCVYV